MKPDRSPEIRRREFLAQAGLGLGAGGGLPAPQAWTPPFYLSPGERLPWLTMAALETMCMTYRIPNQ